MKNISITKTISIAFYVLGFYVPGISLVYAETTSDSIVVSELPAASHTPATTPAATHPTITPPVTMSPATTTPATTAPAAVPVKSIKPKPKPAKSAPATTVVTPAVPAANNINANTTSLPAVIVPEQRHQQEILANAERLDKANRELLARNQELQLQNENLNLQNNVIKRDKSSDGIWKGALAVIIGFLIGWFFSRGRRRKTDW